ncbi:murein hydrolase activator EnvC family protein [Methylocaldum sp.]|uniref:murein hydrolase activator EnvC family protein n=1 Tax=Methylocaldum sp. TaxID=1969727 RepID=UPI002D5C690D|nr:peptidoglycan DD-metalloendopeptidase family protein [Methylocaldum sp.]HYE35849.1 peptidoglycan DD-metalloendopeptidase family protein [Methylocaldum sp.]
MPFAWAVSEPTDRVDELNTVRERIKTVRKSRDALESRKHALVDQLSAIERDYGRLAKTLKELEMKVQAQSRHLSDLERQRSQLQAAVKTQYKTLKGHARAAYAAGRQEWLKLVLNQEDPAQLSRVLAYYNYLNQARSSLVQGMQKDLTTASRLQREVLAETERLQYTREQAAKERIELDKSRQSRREVLASLEHGLQDKDAQLKRLQENEERLQNLVAAIRPLAEESEPARNPLIRKGPFATLYGQLTYPTKGSMLEQFGNPRMSGRWDGVVIGAPEGAPVHAVAEGRVAYSDWLRGYGLLTILDHGDGYMSLYAFNQSLYKNVGDWVSGGDIIATVGASGGRMESGLYFGIREKGRPVNPMLWCSHRD